MSKTLRLNELKTGIAINAKILVFNICAETTLYLLLYILHDCTFKYIIVTNVYCNVKHIYIVIQP